MLRRFLGAFLAVSLSLAATVASSGDGGDKGIAVASRVLKDSEDYRLRVDAALRLGMSGDAKARKPLESALEDAHPVVRQAAAGALAKLGDRYALPALEARAKKEPNLPTRAAMNRALTELKAVVPSTIGGAAASASGLPATAGAPGATTPKAAPGPDWPSVKYVVKINTVVNSSGVRGDALAAVLDASTRAKLAVIPGVYVVSDDAGGTTTITTAAARGVPVVGIDASLVSVDAKQLPGEVRVHAKISLAMTKMQVIKVNIEGSASTVGSAASAKNATIMSKLQDMAVDGAVVSAMSKAPHALKSASGS